MYISSDLRLGYNRAHNNEPKSARTINMILAKESEDDYKAVYG